MARNWDGLTDYEVKRSDMPAELGYAVFALDLFGEGVRPSEMAERQRLTGELYADRQRMRLQCSAPTAIVKMPTKNPGNGSRNFLTT